MADIKSNDFIKHVYTASNSPTPLQQRNLVHQKGHTKKEETYLTYLCKLLYELKELELKDESFTGEAELHWVKETIAQLESLINQSETTLAKPVFNRHMETLKR